MNYEEMSDDKINELVTIAVIKQTFKGVKSVERDGHQSYVWVEVAGFSSQPILDYCNNPADWGKLMDDNSMDIRVGWEYDGEVVGAELWPTALIGDGEDYVFWHSDEKIGRAISICYLESKGANNG